MGRILKQAVLLNIWLTILCGLLYPAVVTGLAQVLFTKQANGSLVFKDGRAVGSALIGQPFAGPKYFQGRPSAAGSGYDPLNSGGSNLGPTSKALMDRVDKDVAALRKTFEQDGPVPADLATASGSGLDPDISIEAARWEAKAAAKARGLSEVAVKELIARNIQPRDLGFLGEPRINVLKLNLELDRLSRR